MLKKIKKWQILLIVLVVLILTGVLVFVGLYQKKSDSNSSSHKGNDICMVIPEADKENQTIIALEQDNIVVTGSGAKASGNTVIISKAGTYNISGTLEEGQICVKAEKEDIVILLLNGVQVTNSSDSAIYIENADQTSIQLAEGTENKVQSGKVVEISSAEEEENASGGAIYSKDNLSLTGKGKLEVCGYINNGIQTKNNLLIENGNIDIKAVNNGVKGKDSVTIKGGEFSIVSGGDGIKSDDTTGETYGVVTITGGKFNIESKGDLVQAETLLDISGGEFSGISGEGSEAANNSFKESRERFVRNDFDNNWDMQEENATSTKGFKCGSEMTISGGTFSVDTYDDAFHSDGTLLISGGEFNISAGDDGIHAETELTISDGRIQIEKSYEGIEGNQIVISGGDISSLSSDDGINAFGGESSFGWGDSSNTTEEMPNLNIKGGNVWINAAGDGLDSNGNLLVEGGTVLVDGPTNSGNGAIDCGSENGGKCAVSGGTIIAIGASGMAESFDDSSTQYSFQYSLDFQIAAGDEIKIIDKDESVIFTHTSAKEASSIVFSCPELADGETYKIAVGNNSAEIMLNSISTSNSSGGGMFNRQHPQRGGKQRKGW